MRRARWAAVLVVAAPLAAHAQVSTDQHALDALGPAKKANTTAHHAASHRAAPSRHHAAAPARPPARIPAPTMAAHPPPPPVIAPPPLHVPMHPPPPPPPVPVDPKAQGSAAAIPNGTRIVFAAGSAAINPAMIAALHAESAAVKASPELVATIDAYAPGPEDDPSAPRRLSLQRALVARAVLINDGVPSPRIYARALGVPPAGDAPPDRIDVTVAPLGAEPTKPSTTGAGGAAP